jgi:serine/threonine protein kinase
MAEAGSDRAAVPMSHASPEVALAATGAASLPQRPGADRGPFNTRIGTVLLDTYRIEALLGAGGCGRVYRATHIRLQGTVAVKFLLPVWTQHEVLRARFDREARLLARLSHPGIVAAHDYGEDQGELYLVME